MTNPQTCPACDSVDTDYNDVTARPSSTDVIIDCHCNHCHSTWSLVYAYRLTQNVDITDSPHISEVRREYLTEEPDRS